MFKTYLKETLSYVIDHFAVESKRHFDLSLTLIIIGTIAATVIAYTYLMIMMYIFGYLVHFDVKTFWEDVILKGQLVPQYKALTNGMAVLFVGLYGSFVISAINDDRLNTKTSYTLKDFRDFISPEEWMSFFKLLLVLILFHFITFKSLQSWFHYGRSEFYYDNIDSQSQVIRGMLSWIDSILDLLRTYLPYILYIFFIITLYENKLSKQVIKEYKDAILVSVFMAFCISDISAVFILYVDQYIIGFIKGLMPMSSMMLIPGAIKLCAYAVFAAYFNWCISASLSLPIKLYAEREEPVEEVHNVELPL